MCVWYMWLLLNILYAVTQGMKASWVWEPFSKVIFTVNLKRQLCLIYTLYVFSVCVIYVIYSAQCSVYHDYRADCWESRYSRLEHCILCVFCMHWALYFMCSPYVSYMWLLLKCIVYHDNTAGAENDDRADWSTVFYVFYICTKHCILCVFCMHWALYFTCSLCMCHICDCYSIALNTMTIQLALENEYRVDWSTVFYVFSGCTEHCISCVLCIHWALYFTCSLYVSYMWLLLYWMHCIPWLYSWFLKMTVEQTFFWECL